MQEVENSVISSGSTSSDDDDRERKNARRRESAASQDRWTESITSSSLGPSIWGHPAVAQDRGRASRSASFSVGQELSNAPLAEPGHSMSGDHKQSSAYDHTRLLREQFQQMRFRNRSKSSYAAAWHVPELGDDGASEDAILDEEELNLRLRRNGEPPGLRYITPSNPRLDNLRERERRASFNNTQQLAAYDQPRSPLSAETLRRDSVSIAHRLGAEALRRDSVGSQNTSHQAHFRSTSGIHGAEAGNPPEAYGNLMADVDRYFSSDDHRPRTRTHLAQTAVAQSAHLTQATSPMPVGPLYIVEFKACRTDVFYVAEGSGLDVHVGDLVIVEADRGRDLGKVIRENVSMSQVRALKAQQAREQALAMGGQQDDSEKINANNVQPKLIYRLSQPSEIAMLLVKQEDEQQATLVCQAKVRQRKLPMEVLDGEYQWDRRKLTFYYYASQRIDFRELVRDLFKIYKTRIWMCASNPTSMANANVPLGAPGATGEPKAQIGSPVMAQHYLHGPKSMAPGIQLKPHQQQHQQHHHHPSQGMNYIQYGYAPQQQQQQGHTQVYDGYAPYVQQQQALF